MTGRRAAPPPAAPVGRRTGTGRTAVRRVGRRVVCDVTSTGRGGADRYLGRLPPGPQQRGYGMWAVRQLCDLLEAHTGQDGTTVRLPIGLARTEGPGGPAPHHSLTGAPAAHLTGPPGSPRGPAPPAGYAR